MAIKKPLRILKIKGMVYFVYDKSQSMACQIDEYEKKIML